jgi:DNA-binding FrmR family transcriptional regulator
VQDEARAEIVSRLRLVAERLNRIHNLVEADSSCGQMLRQLNIIQAELRVIKIQLLNYQINASKSTIHFDPSVDNRLAEVHRLLALYNLLIQST